MKNSIKIKKYPLPKIEINFYIFVWIIHSILAFIISINVYSKTNKIGNWLDHWLEPSKFVFLYIRIKKIL